jgi:hypothetical protein
VTGHMEAMHACVHPSNVSLVLSTHDRLLALRGGKGSPVLIRTRGWTESTVAPLFIRTITTSPAMGACMGNHNAQCFMLVLEYPVMPAPSLQQLLHAHAVPASPLIH